MRRLFSRVAAGIQSTSILCSNSELQNDTIHALLLLSLRLHISHFAHEAFDLFVDGPQHVRAVRVGLHAQLSKGETDRLGEHVAEAQVLPVDKQEQKVALRAATNKPTHVRKQQTGVLLRDEVEQKNETSEHFHGGSPVPQFVAAQHHAVKQRIHNANEHTFSTGTQTHSAAHHSTNTLKEPETTSRS